MLTKEFFGVEDQELVDIFEEWSVQYFPDDERFTNSFNERNRWQVRHRVAPYHGTDENGNWFDTFIGPTLLAAVRQADEFIRRAANTGDNL